MKPANVETLNSELGSTDPQLLASNALLAAVLSGSGDCIKILDLEGRLQFMSEGGKRVMEVENFDHLKGCPWPDFWEERGNQEARDAVASARAGIPAHFIGPAKTAKGTPKYWDVQVLPINDERGRPMQLLSISRDITAQRDAERQAAVIRAELHHRIKNILAMVGAIASQTLRGADVADRRAAFNNRIAALGKAHDLLNESAWTATSVAEVVATALEVHQGGTPRFDISGPDAALAPKQGLSLAMAVHELATNAAKYGPLSGDEGRVTVRWSIEGSVFTFRWQESGGPEVAKPAHSGFGSRLVTRILAAEFDGEVSLTFDPAGAACVLVCPSSALDGA